MYMYLFAARVVDEVVVAGVQRLLSVHGIQNHFIANDNLRQQESKKLNH